MPSSQSELILSLRSLIGTRGCYQENEYELIEVLEQGPAIVLQRCDHPKEIQADMHGEPRRVAELTHTISVFSELSSQLHPMLKEFLGKNMADRLSQLTPVSEDKK